MLVPSSTVHQQLRPTDTSSSSTSPPAVSTRSRFRRILIAYSGMLVQILILVWVSVLMVFNSTMIKSIPSNTRILRDHQTYIVPPLKLTITAPAARPVPTSDTRISRDNEKNSVPPLEITASSRPSRTSEYFDCSKIQSISVVRQIGKGKKKIVYEVILPSGKHVAAKRCINPLVNKRVTIKKKKVMKPRLDYSCEAEKLIMYEDYFYRNLYEAFGEESIEYYGFCTFKLGSEKKFFDPTILTTGSTLFIELGTPILSDWEDWKQNGTYNEEESRPRSREDLDSLRDIARQYDAFPGGPLLLSGDNKYAHQYMRKKDGKLRHIDFDMVYHIPSGTSTLEKNCGVLLGDFAKLDEGDPRFNCSTQYKHSEFTMLDLD